MNCVNCKNNTLERMTIGEAAVVRCRGCGGIWFGGGVLRRVKDEKAEYMKWFDFDLWKDESSFKARESARVCPVDEIKLYTLNYGNSSVEIDACKKCGGVWLDRGEFEKIIDYVKNEGTLELLRNYTANLITEGKEIFTGPESLRSEIADVLLVLKMFQYKFMIQAPSLTRIIMNRISPISG